MNERPGPARAWAGVADDLARANGGRGNALRGLVAHDLELGPGRLRGRVRAARERDADVGIAWAVASDASWALATERLAERARGFVALLDGVVDAGLADELEASGVRVVPTRSDLDPRCDRDGAGWCVHARALHRAAVARIARDPGLVLLLAGCSREVLLARIRSLLGLGGTERSERPEPEARDRTAVDLASIVVRPAPPADVTAVLDRLGPPPGIDDPAALGRVVGASAAFAWAIAAGEGEAEADRHLLVATLRAGGTMTAGQLADALGAPEEDVERELERLHAQGAALRTGPVGLHRYRAR